MMKKWVKILIIVVAVIVGISTFLYFYPPMPLYIYRTENIVDEYFAALSELEEAVNLYHLHEDDTELNEVLERMTKCIKKLNYIHPPAGAKLDYEKLKKALELTHITVLSRFILSNDYTYNTFIDYIRDAWDDWEQIRKKLKK